jgi:hypothetical protein
MNNHGHGEMHDGYLYGNALVLVGSILIFALVLLAVAHRTEEENNLIKKEKLWNIISVKQLTTVSKMQ